MSEVGTSTASQGPAVANGEPDTAAVLAAGDPVEVTMDSDLSGITGNPVEIRLPDPALEVYFDAKIVDSNGVPPGSIISAKDNFYVVWDICVKGPLWRLICGCWCVDLRIESIGAGAETSLSRELGKGCGFRCCFHGCRHSHFCHRVCVPAGTIPADDCSTLYLFAATFQLLDHCGNPAPIVGYEELGVFSFYDPD